VLQPSHHDPRVNSYFIRECLNRHSRKTCLVAGKGFVSKFRNQMLCGKGVCFTLLLVFLVLV
jgi:hypothetical protein